MPDLSQFKGKPTHVIVFVRHELEVMPEPKGGLVLLQEELFVLPRVQFRNVPIQQLDQRLVDALERLLATQMHHGGAREAIVITAGHALSKEKGALMEIELDSLRRKDQAA